MKLIVGLGNPGEKYARNRHNVGFMALDNFATSQKLGFKSSAKFSADIAELPDKQGFLVKPQTFMNNSGQAVQQLAQFYKIPIADILLIYDELALPFGTIRSRAGGQSAGHNGVESVIKAIGPGFQRIRIGIAKESSKGVDTANYVLSNFNQEEQIHIAELFDYTNKLLVSFFNNNSLEPDTVTIS